MSILKPCPFCGGEAKWVEDTGGLDAFGLVVDHDTECFLALDVNRNDFDTAWNTRAPIPVTDEMVERAMVAAAIEAGHTAEGFAEERASDFEGTAEMRSMMRAALTAALGGGNG